MDPEAVKRLLETEQSSERHSTTDSMRFRFMSPFVMADLKTEKVKPGVVICSMKVPARLVNAGGYMHEGAIATLVDLVGSAAICTSGLKMTGISVEINVSHLEAASEGEEVEIEARVLRMGKVIVVVGVEIRKTASGKIVAHGRHSKYLSPASKM